jgi:hypothetical protein
MNVRGFYFKNPAYIVHKEGFNTRGSNTGQLLVSSDVLFLLIPQLDFCMNTSNEVK